MPDDQFPGTLFQIGYVVPDLTKTLAYFNQTIGAPPFMILRDLIVENCRFRGQSANINHSVAFGYTGGMQVEIIEPVSGQSTYSEFLDRVPQGGVHHLGYEVRDYDAATEQLLSNGFREVQRGTFGHTRFGYFETDEDPGTLIEIVYLDDNTTRMFKSIKDQTF